MSDGIERNVLLAALSGKRVVDEDDEELELGSETMGDVSLPTGKLAIFDPGTQNGAVLARQLATGKYHAEALESPLGEWAAAVLRVAEGDVATWEVAARPDGEPARVSVDCGVAAIGDASALELLKSGEEIDLEDIHAGMEDVGDLQIAALRSGAGDGTYRAYWGSSEGGDPLCLVLDFARLDWDDYQVGS